MLAVGWYAFGSQVMARLFWIVFLGGAFNGFGFYQLESLKAVLYASGMATALLYLGWRYLEIDFGSSLDWLFGRVVHLPLVVVSATLWWYFLK